ncbi:M20 family metallopeptidase [Salinicoccus hispanicus]|uniref:M20 metallopeptidase family protein n=1 Tax=Salinicoccus hispanicus TaxID=157225 RepID=UPI002ADE5B86|nr:amidohydrolase [Salinicoccus hispanicus]
MTLQKALFEQLENLLPEMIKMRRHLHMYPELSFKEQFTPEYVRQHLESLGIDYRTEVGGNGVVGTLKGGQPGPTVALRADFDALPIQDEKDVPYRSTIDGVSHSCGHDIHTAALMAVETVLSGIREELAGTVVFIHQFAEELPPGGAQLMIADGCLEGVDHVYGAHVWADDDYGTIGFKPDNMMAGGDNFEITIQGRGGHGAMPHTTVDPLVTMSQLVVNLQQIVSRKMDPGGSNVLTIGKFHSGEAMNVIPDTAFISGTTRSFEVDTKKEMEKWIRQISGMTAAQNGATAEVEFTYGCDPLINTEKETNQLKALAKDYMPDVTVMDKQAMMTSEDFAYFLQHVPGCFFFVGGRNPEIDAVYPHHHPKFDVDERSMVNIGKVFVLAVLHHMNGLEEHENG